MQNYVPNALQKFQHTYPKIPQHAPQKWNFPNYGAKIQWYKEKSSLEILTEQRRKLIQKVVGNSIYIGREVEPTLLVAHGSITAEQSKGTTHTYDSVQQCLYYCANHPNKKLRYHTSGIILIIHSYASYLSALNSRSIAVGKFFMGSQNFKKN